MNHKHEDAVICTETDGILRLGVIVHDDPDGLWAEVPTLPGCVTQADTREELMANIQESMEGWLLVELDRVREQAANPDEGISAGEVVVLELPWIDPARLAAPAGASK